MRSKGKNVREVSKSVPDFFIRFLKNPQLLLERELSFLKFKKIHDIFVEEYKKVPNIVKLKDKSAHFDDVLIVGDIHGHYGSLLRIIKPFLEEKVDSLVFLGDYVDRGKNSFETLILLLMLATTWPNRILLLRGNHEDLHLNKHFGYYDEIKEKLNIFKRIIIGKIYEMIENIYNHLSLMAITPKGSVCMHAGIPKLYFDLAEFFEIPKPHYLIEKEINENKREKIHEIYMQIRWNDSGEGAIDEKASIAHHGFHIYSEREVNKFLSKNQLKRIIKSHESRRGGFHDLFGGKLLHVFSSEPYFDRIKCANTIYEEKSGKTYLCDLNFKKVKPLEVIKKRKPALLQSETSSN